MKFLQKEAIGLPLFVFLSVIDLLLRFTWLVRDTLICNRGVFWGIELPPFWLMLIIGGLLLCLGHLFIQARFFEEQFFLGLMLLGGGVNALDRLAHDCVLDYFSWPLGLASLLPNFNLADMMLLLGLFGLGGIFLKRKH